MLRLDLNIIMALWEFCLSYINIQTALAFLAVFLLLSNGLRQRKNLPPGPISLPLIGNLLSVVFNLYRSGDELEHLLAKMAKQHGDVFSLQVGTKLIVVANTCKTIKEAFNNPLMGDRARSKVFEESGVDEGVVAASGKSWKYQRSFIVSTFRNFGIGRSKFEGNITDEAKTLVDVMCQYNGTAFSPHMLLGNCVSNVTCAVVFGKRYEHSDPEFNRLLIMINDQVEKAGSGGLILFIPILRYIFPSQYDDIVSNLLNFNSFCKTITEEHECVFDKSNIQDIIDVFLNEIEVALLENTDRKDFINSKSLTATAVWLFLGGTETSATTLRWSLLYMITYPEIQVRVQKEIDSVVGRNRLPKWADRLQLPYTEAVLLEIQRLSTAVPLGLPHVTSGDTQLAGYDVPKGSLIISNIWAVHHDPDVWTEPDQFKPERFLDADGKLRHKEEFLPFSTGHRVCLGENLAKMEIFLFFTYILHTLTLKNPSSEPISMKGVGGVTFNPVHFEIVAEKREFLLDE